MTAEIQFREGSIDDTDLILELVKASLGEGVIPRSRAYWIWKHHQNPFGDSSILLAEAEGRLVGLRVFMRWEWITSAGRTVRAVRAVDTATHPEWQGQGIFSKLTRKMVESTRSDGVAFIFNTPNEKSRPGYLKMGWGTVGRTDLWIRPLRPLRIARALVARSDSRSHHASSLSPGKSVGKVLETGEVLSFARDADPRNERDTRFTVDRTESYLRWRYAMVPGFDYRAEVEVGGTADSGAALFCRSKVQGPFRELRICDMILGRDRSSVSAATSILTRIRKQSDADYLSCMAAAGTPERAALIRSGFVPVPRVGPTLTVLPLNEMAGPDPLRRDSWRTSIGDLELF